MGLARVSGSPLQSEAPVGVESYPYQHNPQSVGRPDIGQLFHLPGPHGVQSFWPGQNHDPILEAPPTDGLNYQLPPGRIPRLWKANLTAWSGIQQQGFEQANHRQRISPPSWRINGRGSPALAGIMYGRQANGSVRVPAVFVPTAT